MKTLHCAFIEQGSARLIGVSMMQGLKDATKKLLQAWNANNGGKVWPRRIFFYRDGVSEGQFNAVQMLEIPQIRMACEEVSF